MSSAADKFLESLANIPYIQKLNSNTSSYSFSENPPPNSNEDIEEDNMMDTGEVGDMNTDDPVENAMAPPSYQADFTPESLVSAVPLKIGQIYHGKILNQETDIDKRPNAKSYDTIDRFMN